MVEVKKRKLRLGDPRTKTAKLFSFDAINKLLFREQRIRIDRTSKVSHSRPYHYFEDTQLPNISKKTPLERKEALLPRRQRNKADPLPDEVYHGFHRRMKREEKVMTGADKNKILQDVDTLRNQLQLLRQLGWARHLPRITAVNDINDLDELAEKRKLTEIQIERLLKKFTNWEERNSALQEDIKAFHEGLDDEPWDDSDESILVRPVEDIQKERLAKRLEKHGHTLRLDLHNGTALVAGPYDYPHFEQN